jgi:signal transduction histidine kinase
MRFTRSRIATIGSTALALCLSFSSIETPEAFGQEPAGKGAPKGGLNRPPDPRVQQRKYHFTDKIHDTLTQAFVGISSQLDVMDMRLPADAVPARRSLDLARRMTDHSLTEARRAVMDLRTSALDEQDIAAALRTWAKVWAEDENADIVIDVEGKQDVPQEVGHQVLRIAQEGIANAVKHSGASRVSLWFRIEGQTLRMRVSDDGCGFEPSEAFTSSNGHFGLIGMRERADRVGGELKVDSHTGQGTRLDLTVPLG